MSQPPLSVQATGSRELILWPEHARRGAGAMKRVLHDRQALTKSKRVGWEGRGGTAVNLASCTRALTRRAVWFTADDGGNSQTTADQTCVAQSMCSRTNGKAVVSRILLVSFG